MTCNWIKLYDAPRGGNVLNPNSLTPGRTVYIDISEMPSDYEFIGWKDLEGNLIEDARITLVQGGRYETTVQCGGGFVAYIRTKEEVKCILVVQSAEPEKGMVDPSEPYEGCNTTVTISATPNCCYEFDSWDDISDDRYSPEREVTVLNGTSTYTAHFKDIDYNITVLSNNDEWGTVTVEPSTVHCGEQFTIIAEPAEGYDLLEWNDGETEKRRTIEFQCDGETVYQATFEEAMGYRLTYSYNYETEPSEEDGGRFRTGDPITFAPALSRIGFVFIGWAIEQNATEADYLAGDNGTYLWEEDMTLYAVWEEKPSYRITYMGAPDDESHVYASEEYQEDEIFTLMTIDPSIVPTGFSFVGWCITDEGNPVDMSYGAVTGSYTMPNRNLDAHAVWIEDEDPTVYYKTVYMKGDGTITMTEFNGIEAGTTVPVKSIQELSFEREHYTFSHWASSDGVTCGPGDPYTINADTWFTAIWTADPVYTVVYHLNCTDYTGDVPDMAFGYVNDTITVPSDSGFAREGYNFMGWSTVMTAVVPMYTAGQIFVVTGEAQTTYLFAVWQAKPKFRVYYDKNMKNLDCEVNDPNEYDANEEVTAMDCICSTKTGCLCNGWNTSPDGTGTVIEGGSTFQIKSNMILYAMWDCCSVTFYSQEKDLKLIIDGKSVASGTTVNLTEDTTFDVEYPKGCCFKGWFDMDNCKYLTPCETPSHYTYFTVPSFCQVEKIPGKKVVTLDDEQFKYELINKKLAVNDDVYIYNESTGEIRQSVGVCRSVEGYSLECDSNVMAIMECLHYEETIDETHDYIVYDDETYRSIYEYIEANPEPPYMSVSPSYIGVIINGIQYNYEVTLGADLRWCITR